MSQVVQAKCPHCNNVLRIPMEWVYQPMRCKFCNQVFQAMQRPPAAPTPAAPTPAAPTPAAPAPQSSAKAAVRPGTPPVVPVVAVAPAKPTPVPVARPAPGGAPPSSRTPPPAGRSRTSGAQRPRRPDPRGGWWKPLAVTGVVCVLFGVLALALGPQILDHFDASPAVTDKTGEVKVAEVKGATDPPRPPPQGSGKNDDPPKSDDKKGTEEPTPKGVPKEAPKDPPPDKGKPRGDPPKTDPPKTDPPRVDPPKKDRPPRTSPPKYKPGEEPFPRRALFISVNDYLYANPLEFGLSLATVPKKGPGAKGPLVKGFAGSSTWALKTAFGNPAQSPLRFPNTQMGHLSDAGVEAHPPLKAVIEATVSQFLADSRPQDRVVLFFTGHAVEDDKEAYLVPIEGDLADPKTLIPLSWVYDRLKDCKARQKVIVLDVCRFDPARGQERPGGDPMGKILDAKLQQPPPGVQVLSSCVLEQQSYQLENGSLFIQSLCKLQPTLDQLSIQEPGSPLPLEDMIRLLNVEMDRVLAPYKLKQTARLTGKEAPGGAPPNFEELLAYEVAVVEPPAMAGDVAAVKAIMEELNRIPPTRISRSGAKDSRLALAQLPAFPAKTLEEYKADYASAEEMAREAEKSPFRMAILNAVKVLQENATKFAMKEEFFGASTAQVKAQVKTEQVAPGKAKLYLEEALEELRKVEKQRAKEPSKRWQAHYDYVLSRMLARLIYVTEYNYVLAQIRTDSLPELEAGMNGYRLGARTKVGVPESFAKDWVRELKRLHDRIIAQHENTPWAVMARRDKLTVLGLEWRPARKGT